MFVVARLQHPSGAAPLNGPPLDVPNFVTDVELERKMRAAEEELRDDALDCDGLLRVVDPGPGVVRVRVRSQQQ